MSQAELYQFFKNHPDEWFTIKKLMDITLQKKNALCLKCRKLRENGFITYRMTKNPKAKYEYSIKKNI